MEFPIIIGYIKGYFCLATTLTSFERFRMKFKSLRGLDHIKIVQAGFPKYLDSS